MSLDSYLEHVFESLGGTCEDALNATDLMEVHGVNKSDVAEAFMHAKGEAAAEPLIAMRRGK